MPMSMPPLMTRMAKWKRTIHKAEGDDDAAEEGEAG